MDVTNPDGNSSTDYGGIAFAYKIPHIYITSGSDLKLVGYAKESHPNGFIRKPIIASILNYTVGQFINDFMGVSIKNAVYPEKLRNFLTSKFRLIRSTLGKYVLINTDEIVFFRSDNVHITVTTKSRQFQARSTISQFLILVASNNLIHTREVKSKSMVVDSVELPIGKTHMERVLKSLRSL